MGALSPAEQARNDMIPTHERLDACATYTKAAMTYISPRLREFGAKFDAAGMNEAFRLGDEFHKSWPYRLPPIEELLEADKQGRLEETIAELNAEFWEEYNGKAGGKDESSTAISAIEPTDQL